MDAYTSINVDAYTSINIICNSICHGPFVRAMCAIGIENGAGGRRAPQASLQRAERGIEAGNCARNEFSEMSKRKLLRDFSE